MRIDLHSHSTASDGTDTPAQLVTAARTAGLDVLAITDHDSTGGWDAALGARPEGLGLIRGAEYSAVDTTTGYPVSVHVLGYLFNPADRGILKEQARLREERLNRGLAIVERMERAGVPISAQQVLDIAGAAPVGRPHIGRALMESGVVSSVSEAFRSHLSSRGPFYVRKADTPLDVAVEMVVGAGGVVVIAHPRGRGEHRALTFERIEELAEIGVAGLEVCHPDHPAQARAELEVIADRLGLIRTGSSDYHGDNKTVRLGTELTDSEALEQIVERARGGTPALAPDGSAW